MTSPYGLCFGVLEGRDQLLGCWRRGDNSCQNNIPHRDLPAVYTAVVTVVRTDCGAFEGDPGKQPSSPRVAQDFGSQSRIRIGRRFAPDRARRHGSVTPQFDLAGEYSSRAAFIHHEQHKVRSFSTNLKSEASTLQSHHCWSAPTSSEILTLAARHNPAPVASVDYE